MIKCLAVLGYHKIGPPSPGGWESWYYVSEETFHSHLAALRAGGWTVLDAHSLLRGLENLEFLPARSALITFDDGYTSVLAYAAPILVQFGFPGVIFVPTQFIGEVNSFDEGAEPVERICDWGQLRELERLGVSVQSHAVSHPWLSQLDPAGIEAELANSKATLEKGLQKSVELFAFPYGDAGKDAQSTKHLLSKSGYRAAFLYGGGLNQLPIGDPFAIDRLAIGSDTKLEFALSTNKTRRTKA